MTVLKVEDFFDSAVGYYKQSEMEERAIKFAQAHVKAALKAASEAVKTKAISGSTYKGPVQVIDKESILNCYTEDNVR